MNHHPENPAAVFGALRDCRDTGGCVIAVTHGSAAEAYADRTIHLRDGRIETPTPAGDAIHA